MELCNIIDTKLNSMCYRISLSRVQENKTCQTDRKDKHILMLSWMIVQPETNNQSDSDLTHDTTKFKSRQKWNTS